MLMISFILVPLLSWLSGTFVTVNVDVRDETGTPATNVIVHLSTPKWIMDLNSHLKQYERRPDKSGRATFHFLAVEPYFSCSISDPDGEYEHLSLGYQDFKSTSHDFWCTFHEHSKTLTCVLKHKPIPEKIIVTPGMAGKMPPVKKGILGFDLMKNDWIPPHGRGKIADFWIDYERVGNMTDPDVSGRIFFRDKMAGCYILSRESLDSEPSSRNADLNADFVSSLPFHDYPLKNRKAKSFGILTKKECLVMRTRVKLNKSDEIISAHYSVVRGPFYFINHMSMNGYMFNTRPNDTNLEFKGPIFQ